MTLKELSNYWSKKSLGKLANNQVFYTYDTLKNASQFKPLIDSFPGKYSLLVVNSGKIAFEHYQEPYSKDSLIHRKLLYQDSYFNIVWSVFKEQFAVHENMAAIDAFS